MRQRSVWSDEVVVLTDPATDSNLGRSPNHKLATSVGKRLLVVFLYYHPVSCSFNTPSVSLVVVVSYGAIAATRFCSQQIIQRSHFSCRTLRVISIRVK